jgi:hypothetical protein
MFVNMKFDMDHIGARAENEAVIVGRSIKKKSYTKKFILDVPFWVVIKRKDSQHPYFLFGLKNTGLMEKIK